MIPFIVPKILPNEKAQTAKDLAFLNRAAEITSLPEFLDVFLTSPTGLDMINIGETEPQPAHRNKPWFKTSDPIGVYVWNTTTSSWQNLQSTSAAEIQALVNEAIATAGLGKHWIASGYADDAKAAAKELWKATTDATNDVDDAEAEAIRAVEMYSAGTSGFVSGDVGDASAPEATWAELFIDENDDRTDYAPGFVHTDWFNIPTPLDPDQPIIGWIMLTANSAPGALFNYSVQARSTGDAVRLYGYEVMHLTDPAWTTWTPPRRVCFNYMLKGVIL